MSRYARSLALLVGLTACGYRPGLVDESFSTEVVVEGISLRSATTGARVIVEIFGDNFPEGVEVTFGDVQAEILDFSSGRLMVEAPARAEPGAVEVKLLLPDGRSVTALPDFRYQARELRMRFGEQLGTSGPEAAYGVGDVDGDGRNDLVIAAQRGASGQLAIHLGTERGLAIEPAFEKTLPAALDYINNACTPYAQPKYDLAVADLDEDGLAEVAVTVYREDELTLVEWAESAWRERTVETRHLFDRCRGRSLIPLDTDGEAGPDLLALVNHGPGDAPVGPERAVSRLEVARPARLGSIGYFALLGDHSGALAPETVGCEAIHSHAVVRAAGRDRLVLLCERPTTGDSRELRLVELDLAADDAGRIAQQRTVLASVPAQSRMHLHQLDADQALEVLWLQEIDEGRRQPRRELRVRRGELGADALHLETEGSAFDLELRGPPILLVADVVGDRQQEIVIVWPQLQGEMTALDPRLPPAGECTDGVCGTPGAASSAVLLPNRAMMPPDWVSTDAQGSPAMPTVVVADIDRDGKPDWITTDRWRQTMVAYGSPAGPQALRPWRQLDPLVPNVAGGALWPVAGLPATRDGVHRSALIDLDGDGERDIVSLRMLYGAEAGGGVRVVADLQLGGEGAPAASRQLEWVAGGRPTLTPTPAFGDVDGDGWADLCYPTVEADRGMRLDLVRSSGSGLEGYRVEQSATGELGWITALSVLPGAAGEAGADGTAARLLVAARRHVSGDDSPVDLRAFEWSAARGRLVEVDLGPKARDLLSRATLGRGMAIDGGVRQLFGSASLVQLVGDRGHCNLALPADVTQTLQCDQACGQQGCVQRVFGQGGLAHRVYVDPTVPDTVIWVGGAIQRSSSLAGDAGTFLQPRFETICDLDGDGSPEVVFVAQHAGQSGPVIGALSWDHNEERVSTRLIGAPTVAFEQVDCLQVHWPGEGGLQDLVLRAPDNSYYLIHNRSR